MDIGNKIKEGRIQKGLTQEELAEKINVNVRTIQRIEKGQVEPRAYTLKAIAEILDLDFNLLVEESVKDIPELTKREKIWLPLLHFSGFFFLFFPPLIIWLIFKGNSEVIREQGKSVLNFHISMLIYIIPTAILILPAIFFGVFSSIVIIINTIKALDNQPCRYPMSIKILR